MGKYFIYNDWIYNLDKIKEKWGTPDGFMVTIDIGPPIQVCQQELFETYEQAENDLAKTLMEQILKLQKTLQRVKNGQHYRTH